jgi:acyl-coenzyme A synthetase/AMP-(fatty) acid ligase
MEKFILNNNNSESDLNIMQFINNVDKKGNFIFNTSGTTSKPKQVKHSYNYLIKNIKIDKSFKDCIWALTYHPNTMAASQVILQAYLNGGRIVNLIDKKNHQIIDLIQTLLVTHISATPTFYRMLTDFVFESVKQVTLGGESVDSNIINRVKTIFPNAKIRNIYALTELGSLMSSSDEYFSISPKKSEFIKLKNNTIFVNDNGKWFETGDLVELVGDNRFRIIGRESSIINVGGYKVNPIKVESKINSLPFVKHSKVYGIQNSVLGKIVAVDIVINYSIDIKDIRNNLKLIMNKYEMPLKINIVSDFEKTLTGKIIRQ